MMNVLQPPLFAPTLRASEGDHGCRSGSSRNEKEIRLETLNLDAL